MPRNPETAPPGPWVELDGYKFPLVVGADGKGQVSFRPVTQFSPASQIGPANRPPPDPRFLVATFADLSRGGGIQDIEEIDGLNTYRKGTLDTRFAAGFGLPPVVETLPTALPLAGKGFTGNQLVGGGRTRARLVQAGAGYVCLYVRSAGWYFAYDIATNAVTADTATPYGIERFGPLNLIFAATSTGIKYCVGGTGNWMFAALAIAGDWRGLAVHDNKLWSFNNTDKKVYASNDPATAASWVAESTALPSGTEVTDLLEYKDLHGDPALVLLGQAGGWGLNEEFEPAEWQYFLKSREWGYRELPSALTFTVWPQATVWRKDSNAYFVFPGSSNEYALHVLQHNGTARDVGPLKSGGFDSEDRFSTVLAVDGNTHFLYAFCAGGPAGGEVICQNDTGGWHSLWVNPSTTDPIVAGAVEGGDVYVVLASGTVKVIRDKDSATLPHLRYPSGGGKVQPVADLYTGFLDFGMPNHWKVLAYLFLSVVNRGGGPYLPAGNLLRVAYRTEDGPFGTYIDVPDTTAFPALLPLPDAGQAGLAARRVEFYLRCEQTGTPEPFLVKEFSVYAERWVQPFWAYQFNIDLSERSWPEGKFDGVDLQVLRRKLEQLAGAAGGTVPTHVVQASPPEAPPPHFPVSWGHGRWARSVAAAELMFGGTLDPARGDGIWQVTARDMSMPQPLSALASPH